MMKNSFNRATSPEKYDEDVKQLKALRSEIYKKLGEDGSKVSIPKNAFTAKQSIKGESQDSEKTRGSGEKNFTRDK